MEWITLWANATSRNDRRAENYAKNVTLRYPVYLKGTGDRVRLTFSNLCGSEEISLSRVTFAVADKGSSVLKDTIVPVHFDGQESVSIPVGEEVTSDEFDFSIQEGVYSVSIYLKDYTDMNSTVLVTGPHSTGFFSVGDDSFSPSISIKTVKKTNWFYFLNRIDVKSETPKKGVVCFGDSITAQAWPDMLTDMVDYPVVRRAVCGTRILREYDCVNYASYGIKGDLRFYREIAPLVGIDTVLIQHGINDIIHPVGEDVNVYRPWSDMPTVEDLIQGTKGYIKTAKELGFKVYLGTLLPIYGWRTYAPFREEIRIAFNEWIRNNKDVDGIVDFDKALADPEFPQKFKSGFDSGDHLHPSQEAYRQMALCAKEALQK